MYEPVNGNFLLCENPLALAAAGQASGFVTWLIAFPVEVM
jgi:hypothetical protein